MLRKEDLIWGAFGLLLAAANLLMLFDQTPLPV